MFHINYKDIELKLKTSERVFSPMAIDKGTLAMLSVVEFHENDKVLDLGCGYGPVGIIAAKMIGKENVVLCDISEDAIQLAKENSISNELEGLKIIKSNGVKDVEDTDFTLILSNPPYHVDFSVPKAFIEESYKKLVPSGRMIMVTKRKEWYKNKLISVFGGVRINEVEGYYVFTAEKRPKRKEKLAEVNDKTKGNDKIEDNKSALSKKLARKVNRRNKRSSEN